MFQSVGFIVRLVKFHSQQAYDQPFGQPMAPRYVFSALQPSTGQPYALVCPDLHQSLPLHPADHARHRRHRCAQSLRWGKLLKSVRELGDGWDFGVLPELVKA